MDEFPTAWGKFVIASVAKQSKSNNRITLFLLRYDNKVKVVVSINSSKVTG